MIGGDWPTGEGSFSTNDSDFSGAYFHLIQRSQARELVKAADLVDVELASEESVRRLWPAAGAGLVGAAIFGPVGLFAGLLAGGKRTESTFVARFKDGRTLIATADSKAFAVIKALAGRPSAASPEDVTALEDERIVHALKALGDRFRRSAWPSTEIVEGSDFLRPPYKDLIKIAWMNREKLPIDVLQIVRRRVGA